MMDSFLFSNIATLRIEPRLAKSFSVYKDDKAPSPYLTSDLIERPGSLVRGIPASYNISLCLRSVSVLKESRIGMNYSCHLP